MKVYKLVLIMTLIYVSTESFCQELKRKKKQKGQYTEEYYIIKKSNDVKQGEYVKMYNTMLYGNKIIEIGQFENNQRVGEWFYFYPDGSLKKVGNYWQGNKEGLWEEFYKPLPKEQTIAEYFGGSPNNIIEYSDDNSIYINIDRNKHTHSSVGEFQNNEKTGEWSYYSRVGVLVHRYDHTTKRLAYSNIADSLSRLEPYLGGIGRFYDQYINLYQQINRPYYNSQISKVVVSVTPNETPIGLKVISAYGDESFKEDVLNTLSLIPAEWIINSDIDKEVIFEAELLKANNRNNYKFGFK